MLEKDNARDLVLIYMSAVLIHRGLILVEGLLWKFRGSHVPLSVVNFIFSAYSICTFQDEM